MAGGAGHIVRPRAQLVIESQSKYSRLFLYITYLSMLCDRCKSASHCMGQLVGVIIKGLYLTTNCVITLGSQD